VALVQGNEQLHLLINGDAKLLLYLSDAASRELGFQLAIANQVVVPEARLNGSQLGIEDVEGRRSNPGLGSQRERAKRD
jgi:hypothetical protein